MLIPLLADLGLSFSMAHTQDKTTASGAAIMG